MEDKKTFLSKETFVPAAAVIAIVLAVGSFAYNAGVVTSRLSRNEQDIKEVQSKMITMPTRTEFDDLKDSIKGIKDSVDNLSKLLTEHVSKNQ